MATGFANKDMRKEPEAHVALRGVTRVFPATATQTEVRALGPIDLDLVRVWHEHAAHGLVRPKLGRRVVYEHGSSSLDETLSGNNCPR